jgi:hypothetical protein
VGEFPNIEQSFSGCEAGFVELPGGDTVASPDPRVNVREDRSPILSRQLQDLRVIAIRLILSVILPVGGQTVATGGES